MGFGTLFVGYFLILNFAYTAFTDAIAGILALYGLYKLSNVNNSFKISSYFAIFFSLVGVVELFVEIMRMMTFIPESAVFYSVISITRLIALSLLTAFMLLGMRDVAGEVGLRALSEISERLFYLTIPVYSLSLILEVTGLFAPTDVKALLIASVISLVASLTLTVLILIRIYDCYAKICMPEDKNPDDKPKDSKFGFVNSFRAHEEQKRKEYADYKFEKFKKKMEKRKSKEKK